MDVYEVIPGGSVTETAIRPTRLFRAMLIDEAGRPRCGAIANALGVRSGVDVHPGADGLVGPDLGGLAVSFDDASALPPHLRPEGLGGTGRLPVFQLDVSQLGEKLALRFDAQAPALRGLIVSGTAVPLELFQATLAAMQCDWVKVP